MNRPYKTYNGGKNGSGVYQAIINQIPPHGWFISGFAGNCGVMANKRRAPLGNIVIDTNATVIKDWQKIEGVTAIQSDFIELSESIANTHYAATLFIFLDPPYLLSTRTSKQPLYKNEMTDPATHKNLLLQIKDIKHNCLIIHYPNELYDSVLKDWRKVDIQGRTRNGMRIERLYMNYPQPNTLHDYTYIGKDYREREAFKKSKRNMVSKFKAMSAMERNFIINALQENKIINHATAKTL